MQNIKNIINSNNFFVYLIALILSTTLIGYAPSSIAVGLFVFSSIIYAVINKKKNPIDKALLLPLVFYVFLVCTIFWTTDFDLTVKGIGRLAMLGILPITFHFIPKFSLHNRQLILKYFTYANLLYAIFFLVNAGINYFKTKNLDVFTYHALVEVLDLNAIYVSAFFSISLCYLIGKHQKTFFEKCAIFIFINMMLLLSSKMLIAALILSLVLYFLIFKGIKSIKSLNKTKSIIITLGIIITISVTSKQLYNRLNEEKKFTKISEVLEKEKFNKVYLWTGTSLRLFQLRLLKEQIEERNIFWKGLGLFASRVDLEKRHISYNTYKGFHTYNYHNQYAQVMAEAGFFGLIILLLLLFSNFKKAYQSEDFLFITFSILLIMLFFTESLLWVQRGILFTSIFYCLFNRTNYNKITSKN